VSEFRDLIPTPAVEAVLGAEGHTVLLRPKFVSPRFQWFQRLMWKPYFRVKLDEVGALIWSLCDGVRSVEEVCREVRARFGERAEPVESRVEAFLRSLAAGCFLRLLPPPM